MPRARKRRLFPIALSIEAACEAIGVSRRYLNERVADTTLPAYSGPNRCFRVLVPALIAPHEFWPAIPPSARATRPHELIAVRPQGRL